jgi:hypothetical protein
MDLIMGPAGDQARRYAVARSGHLVWERRHQAPEES